MQSILCEVFGEVINKHNIIEENYKKPRDKESENNGSKCKYDSNKIGLDLVNINYECLDKNNDCIRCIQSRDFNIYNNFKVSSCEYDIYRQFGNKFLKYNSSGNYNKTKINILDIGSGNGKTALALFYNIDNTGAGDTKYINYVSIDDKVKPDIQNKNINHIHLMNNFYNDEIPIFERKPKENSNIKLSLSIKEEISKYEFDIVIIDLEPHGYEILIYELIKEFMKDVHLCILKHVTMLNMWGYALADYFIDKYYKSGVLTDYFSEDGFRTSSRSIRDLFVLFSKEEKNIKLQDFASGKLRDIKYSDKSIYTYCKS